jgi:hypothetical protein
LKYRYGIFLLVLKVTYQEMPAGVPVQLPVVESVENQSEYSVTTPDLFPGGTYKVKVQVWQNVSGESAGSPLQEINGTTSMTFGKKTFLSLI